LAEIASGEGVNLERWWGGKERRLFAVQGRKKRVGGNQTPVENPRAAPPGGTPPHNFWAAKEGYDWGKDAFRATNVLSVAAPKKAMVAPRKK